MKIIKRILGLSIILLMVGSVTRCTNDRSVGPEGLESVKMLQSSAPSPSAHWLSDYFPLNPHQFGIRTYYWYDEEEYFVAMIVGKETVPYTSGSIEATKLLLEGEEIGLYIDGEELWWPVIQDDYYVSDNCALNAYPFDGSGKVWDGMYVDVRDSVVWLVNKDNPTDCVLLPPNDRITLFKIDDVNIFGEKHDNALILWSLEPGGYQPLDFGGYEEEWGITLPTEEETQGNAVDGFVILGFHKGIVAMGETSDDGLDDLALLVSEVPTDGVVHHASMGGADMCEALGLPTGCDANFSLVATQKVDGSVEGQWQDTFGGGAGGIHVAVDCLNVVGNGAVVGGVISHGTAGGVDVSGQRALTAVVDYGTSANDPADQFSFSFFDTGSLSCTDLVPDDFPPFTLTHGQVKVW